MQSLLSSQAAVICALGKCGPLPFGVCIQGSLEDCVPPQMKSSFQKILDNLDVFLVDHKVTEAVEVIRKGTVMLSEAQRKGVALEEIKALQTALAGRRALVIEQLIGTTKHLSIHGNEFRTAITALEQLGDSFWAHNLLLDSHHKWIHYGIKNLRPCGTLYGGLYTAALSQSVFSGIHQASKDTQAVFGDHMAHASKMVLWAYRETEGFVALLKKHVLLVAGGLHAAIECVRIAYGHCLLLESQGLALCPFLCKALRPTIMRILQGNLEHIKDTVTSMTAADNWTLGYTLASRQVFQRALYRSSGGKLKPLSEFPAKLSVSAHQLDTLAQDLFLKLNKLLKSSEKLLSGRNTVLLLPLMKITKGVLLWLKYNDKIWKAIEESSTPLRPEGCIQFVFDLHFVVQFSSNGGFSSRSLGRVASDLMCHVQNLYAENGSDIESVMPTDDWFVTSTQKSLQEILSKISTIQLIQ